MATQGSSGATRSSRSTSGRASAGTRSRGTRAASTGARRSGFTPPKTDLAELRANHGDGSATVYLAEKHSIARALADALPGPSRNKGGYIECGGNLLVTWLSGHLLEQAPPEEYDPALKSWTRGTLPIVPREFRLLPKKDRGSAAQLEVIKTMLEICDSAVNAADFDREGQLLVDEVLDLVHYRGTVRRLQTKALDLTSLRRELSRMRANADFAGLASAARARSQLDWLAGMNLTRAMTLHGRALGADGVLSLGRVQTPTLALVVERDLTIENFEPKPFYKLTCVFKADQGDLPTALVVDPDMPGVDSEKRLVDKAEAERVRDLVSGHVGSVTRVEKKRVQEQAPLPYTLTDLQKEASAKFGMGAQQTLAAAQSLYEAKLISYPRTDCPYLPEEQHPDAAAVLAAVGQFEGMAAMVAACDPSRRSAAWNTSRVEAHHGIIPTREKAGVLRDDHQLKVYTLVCRRYAWQFLPPHVFHKTTVDVTCEGFLWRASGRREESAGWTEFRYAGPAALGTPPKKTSARSRKGADADGDEENGEGGGDTLLPEVAKGEAVFAGPVKIREAMTTPPPRFTEGTLVDAMENVQRYVKGASKDDQTILKKTEGLGTVATRAGIIETLFQRKYLRRQGKSIISTELGRDVVANCPGSIRDPLMTAAMERSLSEIQAGRLDPDAYVASYAESLPSIIDEIFSMKGTFSSVSEMHPCPRCGRALRLIPNRKGERFWACTGYPDCRYACDDRDGEPVPRQYGAGPSGQAQAAGQAGRDPSGQHAGTGGPSSGDGGGDAPSCPRCGRPLRLRNGSRGPFWGCTGYPDCRYTCDDANGRPVPRGAGPSGPGGPGFGHGAGPGAVSGTGSGTGSADAGPGDTPVCPRCGSPLRLRNGSRGPFWGCSSFPNCRFTRDLQPGEGSGAPGVSGTPGSQGQAHAAAGARAGASSGARAGSGAAGHQGGGPVCPRCGSPLRLRNGSRGPFWGCSSYPNCRFTADRSQFSEDGAPDSPDNGPSRGTDARGAMGYAAGGAGRPTYAGSASHAAGASGDTVGSTAAERRALWGGDDDDLPFDPDPPAGSQVGSPGGSQAGFQAGPASGSPMNSARAPFANGTVSRANAASRGTGTRGAASGDLPFDDLPWDDTPTDSMPAGQSLEDMPDDAPFEDLPWESIDDDGGPWGPASAGPVDGDDGPDPFWDDVPPPDDKSGR